jgi:hypothetical protein
MSNEYQFSDDTTDEDLMAAVRASMVEAEERAQEDDDMSRAIGLSRMTMKNSRSTVLPFDGIRKDSAQSADPDRAQLPHDPHKRHGNINAEVHDSAPDRSPAVVQGIPFTYEPLRGEKHIRLLVLERQHPPEGVIECVLFETSIDDPGLPHYSTLSYAWDRTFDDGSHLTDTIRCNRQDVRVTPTLNRALKRICDAKWFWTRWMKGTGEYFNLSTLFLWVDGICINQADDEEKSCQVALMPDIYARCDNMIVWLGEHSMRGLDWGDAFYSLLPYLDRRGTLWSVHDLLQFRDLGYAVECMEDAGQQLFKKLMREPSTEFRDVVQIMEYMSPSILMREYSGNTPDHLRTLLVDSNANYRGAFTELIRRPWFRRRWVAQEVAQTANKLRYVLIADQLLEFEWLVDAVRRHNLMEYAGVLDAKVSNSTLLENLARYEDTLCSHAHDRIYAILGLSQDCSWLRVDYRRMVEDLYATVALHYITKGHAIAVLALASAHRSQCLPSWIPDWREPRKFRQSSMHYDAVNALTLGGRKLVGEVEQVPVDCTLLHVEPFPILRLKAWLIPHCLAPSPDHDSNTCKKCIFLETAERTGIIGQHGSSQTQSSATGSNHKGKQSLATLPITYGTNQILGRRRSMGAKRWSPMIEEEMRSAFESQETLCLLDRSPYAFVLRPVAKSNYEGLPNFTLEFCFQVDDIVLMTNWVAHCLEQVAREQIYLV